jgi:hypothetical protein
MYERRFAIALFFAALLMFSSYNLRAQPTLLLSSGSASPGGSLTLTLSLSGTAANPPAALQWTFSYPVSAVSNLTVTAGAGLVSAGKTLSCAWTTNGYTCVASGINRVAFSDGTVANVAVTLSGSTPVSIGLSGVGAASSAGFLITVPASGGQVSVASPAPTAPTTTGGRLPSSTSAPSVVSMSESGSGTAATFSAVYGDSAGFGQLTKVQFEMVEASGIAGCWVYYVPQSNTLWLFDDNQTTTLGPITPGGSGTLSNSQCVLSAAGSSVSGSGTNLSVALALSFESAFAGIQNIYLYAQDSASSTGWQLWASWLVPRSGRLP